MPHKVTHSCHLTPTPTPFVNSDIATRNDDGSGNRRLNTPPRLLSHPFVSLVIHHIQEAFRDPAPTADLPNVNIHPHGISIDPIPIFYPLGTTRLRHDGLIQRSLSLPRRRRVSRIPLVRNLGQREMPRCAGKSERDGNVQTSVGSVGERREDSACDHVGV